MQGLDQVVGVGLGEGDLDPGMVLVELRQQSRHVHGRARDHHAHGDVPAHQPGELVDGQPCAGHRPERGPGVREHGRARRREAHRAPRAVEQLLAELTLQPADLGAHAGLGDVHPGRRLGEARLLHHRHEVLKLPQLHNA